jgi:monoamine oxidase
LCGEGIRSFSALLMLATEVTIYRETRSFLPNGGMDQLPLALGRKLGQNISYNAAVRRIAQDGSGVRVEYDCRGELKGARGDYLICAIPFPILGDLEVSPAFSPAKIKVIQDQPLTSVTRVFVQCREQFLNPIQLSGAAFTDLPIGNTYPAFQQTGQRAILQCYAAGQNARNLAAMPPVHRDRFAIANMDKPLPGIAEFAEGSVTKIWDSDPWARGAYAWAPPGRFLEFLRRASPRDGFILPGIKPRPCRDGSRPRWNRAIGPHKKC